MNERWLPIPGFDGYEISDLGRARSFLVKRSGRIGKRSHILRPGANSRGYLFVNLRCNGESHVLAVHRLVALTFIGPRPNGMVVCHYDDNKKNNKSSNIRYATLKENSADRFRNHPSCKMKIDAANTRQRMILRKYLNDRAVEEYKAGLGSLYSIAPRFNLSPSGLSLLVRGLRG